MKIAFFHHSLRLGSGIDTVIYEIANRLAKKNLDVSVFCFTTTYNQNQCHFNLRVINSALTSSTTRQMTLAPFLMDKIGILRNELEKFDIVNTHHYPANYIVKNLSGPVNVITEWSGARSEMFSSLKEKAYIKWINHAHKSAVHNADAVLAPCEFVKNWVKEKYKINATNMYLDGVNFQLFDREAVSPELIYKLHPRLEGRKIILFVGRMTESKNVHLLIDIFSRVKKDCHDATLLLVGDYFSYSTYYHLLKERIRKFDLAKDIIFAGIATWENLPKYFSGCDIYASCSSWEGFLRAEAFAFSKPIICFETGANSETVKNNQSGYLIEFPNINEFANNIVTLLDDDSLARKLGASGYEWAKRFLDFDVISDNFLGFCENVKTSVREDRVPVASSLG